MKKPGIKKPSVHVLIAIAVPAVMLGGIGVAALAGWWKTSGGREVLAASQAGNAMAAVADIRGSTSFGTLTEAFGIPSSALARAFGIADPDPSSLQAKALEERYGEVTLADGREAEIGTDSVRLFVAAALGLSYAAEDTTALPPSALDVIRELNPGIEPAALDALKLRLAPDLPTDGPTAPVTQPLSQSQASAGQGFSFTGRTSFADLLAAGASKQGIEGVLGTSLPEEAMPVKEWCERNGKAFSDVKNSLLLLLD